MSKFKTCSVASAARQYGLPCSTLYGWITLGKLKWPEERHLLDNLRKDGSGRYYLSELPSIGSLEADTTTEVGGKPIL